MDRRRGNIVVSRRTVLEESRAEQRHEIVANLEEGQVIDGTVKNLTDYGAFVDLGGIDGLLHVTDIAWRRVNHPSEVLTIGQQVKVRIIKINHETHRISLGMKQLQEDPWSNIETRYQVGQKLKGRVTNIADYGAFVELEPGIEGLIHVSEMSWTKKNVHPGKIVSTSQEVEVQVLEVDASKRRISLGLKQTLQNPWEAFAEKHPVGSTVEGEVKNKTEFGLFIGLDGDVDGMVHLSDLDWNRPGEQAIEDYKKGDKVHAKVLDVDVEKERIAIGIKQLASDPFPPRRPRGGRRGRTAQGLGRHLRGPRGQGRRSRGEDRRHGSHRLHQAQRTRPRPRRPAPRALLGRREGRRAHHPVRPPGAQDRRLDQGARSRRGEGGDRAIRLGRLGRLARRHSRRGAESARQRRQGEVTASASQKQSPRGSDPGRAFLLAAPQSGAPTRAAYDFGAPGDAVGPSLTGFRATINIDLASGGYGRWCEIESVPGRLGERGLQLSHARKTSHVRPGREQSGEVPCPRHGQRNIFEIAMVRR